MERRHVDPPDSFDDRLDSAEASEAASAEAPGWLPGGEAGEPERLPPGRRGAPRGAGVLADWSRAEAGCAVRLARAAGRLGALDERLRRAPPGWRQRLALLEAVELGWALGERVAPDRLALWLALRLAGAQADTGALARLGWAVRRLQGGPGPEPAPELVSGPVPGTGAGPEAAPMATTAREAGAGAAARLAEFLDRRARTGRGAEGSCGEPLGQRAGEWLALMAGAAALHPLSRACMGFHLWALDDPASGRARGGGRLEAAVTAARIAAGDLAAEGGRGAVFAPLAMGGAAALHAGGLPAERLARWLEGTERACLAALRHLDGIEAWRARAEAAMTPLSGRTPPALRAALAAWPLLSAPMAAATTGASRAAVQRNLTWMQARGLIREVTGQGRFRLWRIVV